MNTRNKARLTDAIIAFWQNECGFCPEQQDYEHVKDMTDSSQFSILWTHVYDGELVGGSFLNRNGIRDNEHDLEVFANPEEYTIIRTIDGEIRDTMKFNSQMELIKFIRNMTEGELMFTWSDEFTQKYKEDLLKYGETV